MTPAEIETAAPGDERRVLEWLYIKRFGPGSLDVLHTESHASRFVTLLHAGAYLDAAMMLVPDGRWISWLGQDRMNEPWGCILAAPGSGADTGNAATPALALCAAIAKGIE